MNENYDDYCKPYGPEEACYPTLFSRIPGEIIVLGIISALFVYTNKIDNLINKSLSTPIDINNLYYMKNYKLLSKANQSCEYYKEQYFENKKTPSKVSDIEFFKNSLNDLKDKIKLSHIFLIILIILSIISILNSILTFLCYGVNWTGDYQDTAGNACFFIIGIKCLISLIFIFLYFYFFLNGSNKFKNDFLDVFFYIVEKCNLITLKNKHIENFEDFNDYFSTFKIISIIGIIIKILANTIFLSYEI